MSATATIFVDADACPVKAETLKVAERHGMMVTFVANGGLRPSRDPMVKNVVVSAGFDAADDWIVEQAEAKDIVITADIVLAGRCVEKGCVAIAPNGRLFDASSIGMATAARNLNQYLREAGEIDGRNAPFTQRDRSQFLQVLDRVARQGTGAGTS